MMEGTLVFWKYRTLFSLILCTLLLFRVHLAQSAPAPQQHIEAPPLSKISPRGSHWAVGHLMGKKSIEEFPYGYDGGEKMSTVYSGGDKPMEGYQQWKEAFVNVLRMLEANDYRNSQPVRDTTFYSKKPWDNEENNYKEMLDYLYQLMAMRDTTQS
ncbi:gastrin-releasing peptide [Spea bombifrons]|uniref:gastrin-releasing peptide n=1 Tax=Spea bombifrons TaxID=233779 RepID=UPI002348F6DF|nr:gastrin-releasing peptide [Spea bombifrons]